MIKQLLCKWFGLDPYHCATCEVLREQLAYSERERRELLAKILEKDKPESVIQPSEPDVPITPHFTPWRVRQQLLEQEDHKKAQLMRDKEKEIKQLENELGITSITSIEP